MIPRLDVPVLLEEQALRRSRVVSSNDVYTLFDYPDLLSLLVESQELHSVVLFLPEVSVCITHWNNFKL